MVVCYLRDTKTTGLLERGDEDTEEDNETWEDKTVKEEKPREMTSADMMLFSWKQKASILRTW